MGAVAEYVTAKYQDLKFRWRRFGGQTERHHIADDELPATSKDVISVCGNLCDVTLSVGKLHYCN